MGEVVILIISHKSDLSIQEKLSLKQCYKILGKHPIKIICPKGLDVSCYKNILPDPQFDFIEPLWLSTYENFNRLKIEPFLYKRYDHYRYILFYEPDAFVFKDELEYWCKLGYDYIGAPWFENFLPDSVKFQEFAGNGGFSLRKIESILKVHEELKSFRYFKTPKELVVSEFRNSTFLGFCLKLPKLFAKSCGFRNSLYYFMRKYKSNEDKFWVNAIPKYFPDYKVAKYFEAIPFSFECQPKRLFELNNYNLPFGCHAWGKYEFSTFWCNYIRLEE